MALDNTTDGLMIFGGAGIIVVSKSTKLKLYYSFQLILHWIQTKQNMIILSNLTE